MVDRLTTDRRPSASWRGRWRCRCRPLSSTCTCSRPAASCARRSSGGCAPARSSPPPCEPRSAGSPSGAVLGAEPRPARRVPRRGPRTRDKKGASNERHRPGRRRAVNDPIHVRDRANLQSLAAARVGRVGRPGAKAHGSGPNEKSDYSLDFRVGGREHLAACARPTARSLPSTPSSGTSCGAADHPCL